MSIIQICLDIIDTLFNKIGITGSELIALQFIIGLIFVAISLTRFTEQTAILSIMGIGIGAYLMLKAVK